MTAQELNDFTRDVHEHLFGHILPFWCGPALDHEHGGWMAWLASDLASDRTKPKGLVVNARILWAFSAAHRSNPDEILRSMADRALDILMNRFWDQEHGGAYWQLADDWRLLDDSKKTYGQAFYIYALTEYHQAFGDAAALERAKEVFELIERHPRDVEFGGYFETRRADWSGADDVRLSEKDMNEKKSMNNHLHILEAFTNLVRAWSDARVAHRLRELIDIFERRILDAGKCHLNHFFDEAWRVRSATYTFGHDIEASWLLCEAAEVLGDAALLSRVRELALRMAEAVLKEGLDPEGGLCYEGKAGCVIDRGKEWWPQAEALVGFVNAFELSRDRTYLAVARRIWGYLQNHLVDREHGEWFWRIRPDGRPDPQLPKVSEWKGPYHGVRACLELLRRLRLEADGLGGACR